MPFVAPFKQRSKLRRAALAAYLVAAFLALVAGRAAFAATTLAEAPAIRHECAAAKASLATAWTRAAKRDRTYRVALRDAVAHVDTASLMASAAAWPSALTDERSKLLSDLAAMSTALARLESSKSPRASRVRRALAPEIGRVSADVTLLETILGAAIPPPPAPGPAPTPAPLGTIATLSPGTGFTAAVPQPVAVGTGPGADATAIARWDVVPYQTIATKTPVGVVAFHIGGIASVDFSLNGGPWLRVTEMTQNPLTRVWEYSAYVDPSDLSDGLLEVRAVVRPKVGIARVLAGPYDEGVAAKGRGEHSLVLYANAQGTLPSRLVWVDSIGGDDATADGSEAHPFKDLNEAYLQATQANPDVSGLTLVLTPGDYTWPYSWAGFKENAQYMTVAGAPGQPRTAARITYADPNHNRGLDARHVCIRNLTVVTTTIGNETQGGLIWADGCDLQGGGIDTHAWILQDPVWGLGIWLTRPVIHGMNTATLEYRFMRDYEIYDIGEDAIRDFCGFAINGYVHDMRYGNPYVHSDVIQFYDGLGADGQFENVAIYGLKSRRIGGVGEGVLGLLIRNYSTVPSHRDLAFVNCDMEYAGNAQILHSVSHLLIWHCNFLPNPVSNTGGSLLLRDDPPDSPDTRLHNFSLRNSVVSYFSSACSTEPVVNSPAGDETWADRNHIVKGPAVGTKVTEGGPLRDLFVDPENGDDEPVSMGPLCGRVHELLVPADVNGRVRTVPDCVGATVRAAE
jgi:hypothetical protein